jgi:hypothetical protein
MSATKQNLIASLRERWTPEQVVKTMLDGDVEFTDVERQKLKSVRAPYSYMNTRFAQAAGLDRQLKVAKDLFPSVPVPEVQNPETIAEYVAACRATLQMTGNDFKANRIAHKERIKIAKSRKAEAKLMPVGHRAYNKRFRFLARLAEHVGARAETAEMRELAQIAKSRLAFKLDASMLTNLKTVCFVAYMAAKLNKRSIFTFGEQENPYDSVADMLFRRLGRGANWLAVAYVHPEPEVLTKLSEQEKGTLLGVWFSVMTRAVKVLDREVRSGGIDLKDLIVRRGNDSSTWNEAAGAYNKARDGWINTLYALGMQDALDMFVPGKALRLMAADVAWGHRHYGDGLDPNTAVWRELPKPWEVILYEKHCTREMVEKACKKHNCHGGWLAPKQKSVAEYTPTPELVHGVIVSSPELAHSLKKAGYFAGHKGKVKGYVPHEKTLDGLTVKVGAAQEERDVA